MAELQAQVLAAAALAAQVLAELRRILRDELGVVREVLAGDDLVRDLQLDSVGALTLVVGLEDKFRVALEEADAAAVHTVGELVALVVSRVEAAKG